VCNAIIVCLGRQPALASESEADPPFASEDSTDHPSSDYDFDSDGPARRLRRTKRIYNGSMAVTSSSHSREYIDYRTNDFVWVNRPGVPVLPGIVSVRQEFLVLLLKFRPSSHLPGVIWWHLVTNRNDF
jgi:hypothetical protein